MYYTDFRMIYEQLREMGFVCQNGIFYRIKNDVFQNIEIRHAAVNKEYRVEFGILPLCAGIKDYHQGCLYNLVNFCNSEYAYYNSGWSYVKWKKQAKEECINSICSSFWTYLVPLMTTADCCKTGFCAVTKMLRSFEETRLAGLALSGDSDRAIPFTQWCLLDSCLMYMALKNEDYDYVLKALREVLIAQEAGYERNLLSNISGKALQRKKRAIFDLQDRINCIERGDFDALRHRVLQNEEISKKYLDSLSKPKL